MHPCRRGETLTRSVQENAANRKAATITRAQVCEWPERFIGTGASDKVEPSASNLLSETFGRPSSAKAMRGPSPPKSSAYEMHRKRRIRLRKLWQSPRLLASLLWSTVGLSGRCECSLERNAMTGSRPFRNCACPDLFRPFGVLVIWVLI